MEVLRGQGRRAFRGVQEDFPSHPSLGLGRVWGRGEEYLWESQDVRAKSRHPASSCQVKERSLWSSSGVSRKLWGLQ